MQSPESDPSEALSKSRRKRDMLALQKLGQELLGFPDAILRGMDLPQALLVALTTARRIRTRGGQRRQMQYIGKLMRQIDTIAVQAAIAAQREQAAAHTRAFHRLEELRERLIEEGEASLALVLGEFPGADARELRRLAHQARAERDSSQPPRAARALFRYLRALQADAG
jgi:ribosome-associated protein